MRAMSTNRWPAEDGPDLATRALPSDGAAGTPADPEAAAPTAGQEAEGPLAAAASVPVAAARAALRQAGRGAAAVADAIAATGDRLDDIAGPVVSRVLGTATPVASRVRRGARPVVRGVRGTARPVVSGARMTAHVARHAWRRQEAARERLLKRHRRPLPNLYEAYPEAIQAARHEIGLTTVPVDAIRGTAVQGAAQRGTDFLPLKILRGNNWSERWSRIRRATEQLESLPPIDVVEVGDSYWVLDGHNRVAAARLAGQVDMDAVVTELRVPGVPSGRRPGSLSAVLEADNELRAARALGRLPQRAEDRDPADGSAPGRSAR
jgi:hypothetical protein